MTNAEILQQRAEDLYSKINSIIIQNQDKTYWVDDTFEEHIRESFNLENALLQIKELLNTELS